MYKISAPIMATTVTKENRARYAELCKEAGVERIFLATSDLMRGAPKNLKENVEYFQECGFEVGIWTDTIGHGVVLSHEEGADCPSPYTQMVDLFGKQLHHACCPLDPAFQAEAAKRLCALAETGASIIMLDDDFRLSHHGGDLSCGCPLHMERISKLLGEPISLEELRPYLISGKENKYRSAWLQAQSESLLELATAFRKALDKEHPDTNLCFCSCACLFDTDGVDAEKLTRILAGKNQPIMRLCGAPYWAAKGRRHTLPASIECARLTASFMDDSGIERMAEGDVYPRPRYTCPASFLELYDQAMRIDGGYEGILKYMFDYVAGPDFEPGYLKFHQQSAPIYQKLPKFFPKGANAGVRIHIRPHTYEGADLDLITRPDSRTPYPADGAMLAGCGIPTIYRGKGFCNSVFGENAREYDLSLLKEGTILDATAAMILMERGVDLGIEDAGAPFEHTIAFAHGKDATRKSLITEGAARLINPSLKAGAEVELFYSEPSGSHPLAYRYENQKGERFLVMLFEGASTLRLCGLLKCPSMQELLHEELPWVGRAPLPAACFGNPELFLMAEREEDSISIALLNCFADRALQPVVQLDREYSRIECLNCEASLEGDRLILQSPLHGFTFAAFKCFE